MTYLAFLIAFLLPPIILVYAQLWRDHRRCVGAFDIRPVLALALVALAYTTPWDNYLVANRVWWYRPDWVLGPTLAWVPLEEYAFFILQTLLTGGWTLLVVRLLGGSSRREDSHGLGLRWATALAAIAAWLASAAALLTGPPQLTYLALILVWALPPLALQAAFGADLLYQRAGTVLLSIGVPTLYLILADALAIRTGTWVINPDFSLSTRVAGFPLEEALFFFITNTLVVVGLTLWTSHPGHQRALAWSGRLGLGPHGRAHRANGTMPTASTGGTHEHI
jgi:lycopene cyclase domain-containing protein